MRKIILIALISLFSIGLFAQDTGVGIGMIVGEPTGFSAKLWTSERTAVDAAVGWSYYNRGRFHIQSDFLFHNYDLFDVGSGELLLYYGAGAFLAFSSELGLGLRAPIGVAYHFEDVPVEIFSEIAPGIAFYFPQVRFYFGGGFGARYYF